MDEMEKGLNSILSNPEAMQKIMAMAQSLSSGAAQAPSPQSSNAPAQETAAPPEKPVSAPAMPDLSMLQKLSGLSGQTGIDKNQRSLLRALAPYLSKQRIARLERAMQAAKMAQFVSTALNGAQSNKGR